jgi:hypothetical protein
VLVTMRGSSFGRKGSFTASEPAAMMACLNLMVCAAVGQHDLQVMRVGELAVPCTTVTLRILAIAARPPVSLPMTFSLCAFSLPRSTGGGEAHAERGEVLDLVHHRGHVQQRLGRDAADVQAHAAERREALDQHGLQAQVGGAECGRITARAGTEHEHVALEVGAAGVGRCDGRGRRCGGRGRRGCGRRGAGAATGAAACRPRPA